MPDWVIMLAGIAVGITLAFVLLQPRNVGVRMLKGGVTLGLWIAIVPTALPWLQDLNDSWFTAYPRLHAYIAGTLMATLLGGIYAVVAFAINKMRGVEEEEDSQDNL